jgi:hypothetical protein
MAEPVVYVSTWKVKEGKFDEYRRFYAKQLKIIDEAEPQIVAFLAFANEDGTEMTHVHVHPDRSSMDKHMGFLAEQMGVLAEDLSAVYEFMEPVRTEVFGTPGDRAMEMDKPLIDAGVPFTFKPRLIGGFTRSARR